MNVEGTVDSNVGVLRPDQVRFTQSAVVNVSQAGDRLTLETNAMLFDGSYLGDGAIEQQGDIQVHADITINTAEYDWGNSTASEAHDTNINGDFTFEINSATTGTPRNEYRGTINVIGGTLAVNTDSGWLLPRRNGAGDPAGTLVFNAGDVSPPKLTGMPLTVEGNGRAEAGPSIVQAEFITTPSADVQALLSAELILMGTVIYDGGNIHGDGEIIQSGPATVVSNTAIHTKYYDFDGNEAGPSTTSIEPGVHFTINSERIDQPGEPYDGPSTTEGGTPTVTTPTALTIGSGGTLQLINNNGPAWVDGAHLNVSGDVVTSGGNEIFAPLTFSNTASVTALQSGDILRLRDHTNYEGGAYQGQGGIIQDATAFVNAPTTIDLRFFDMDGTTESNFIELHDDLTLNVASIDMSDANQFGGVMAETKAARLTVNTPSRWKMNGVMNVAGAPGTVVTVAGAEMKLLSSATVLADNVLQFEADVSGAGSFVGGGEIVFLGEYNPGNSPALVSIDGDVRFGDAAALRIEIGGVEPGLHYDSLVIDGVAELAGALDITLIDAADSGQTFVPEFGNHFSLIEATGDLIGAFDVVNLPWAGPGLGWDIGYVDGAIQMKVIESRLSTDADYDDDVDGFDFLAIQRHGGSHISEWEQEFGVRPDPDTTTSVVPEPATCAMLALVATMHAMKRRQKTRFHVRVIYQGRDDPDFVYCA